MDLEQVTEDPPERVSAWLASVADVPLRALDRALLVDLLVVELDPLRWRDMADTVMAHADELVGEGCFDQAWQLVEAVIEQGAAPVRQLHATAALERFGGGGMMKHVAAHLRQAGDAEYGRFMHLCHAIGTAVVAPLAEALSGEQEAHARARLRDILVGFGPPGRESVQQLMHASNWEVRRVAAYLLREFGGAEGLKELVPLLADPEPLVRREAVQCARAQRQPAGRRDPAACAEARPAPRCAKRSARRSWVSATSVHRPSSPTWSGLSTGARCRGSTWRRSWR